jgi:hypothetical protein
MSQNDQFQNPKSCIDTVKVSELKEAAEKFLVEAEQCSKYHLEKDEGVMGLATMTTAFAIVITIGETLVIQNLIENHDTIKRPRDFQCIEAFCDEKMNSGWFVQDKEPKQGTLELLTRVRNDLTHKLSLPRGVVLLPTKDQYPIYPKGTIGIVPSLFVEAIKERTARIFSEWSTPTISIFNPSKAEFSPIMINSNFGTTPR